MLRNTLLPVALLAAACSSTLAAVQLTGPSGTYTQNFDALPNDGTAIPWTASNLTDWYISKATFNASSGSLASTGFYSYGTAGATERALGAIAGDASGPAFTYGVELQNANAAGNITSVTLTYRGEQWRNGGNTSKQNVTVAYSLDATSLTTGTWTAAPATLTFLGPKASSSQVALNGNDPTNSATLSDVLFSGLAIAPGQTFWIRWLDALNPLNDHGLAIDDVQIDFVSSAPPTGPRTLTWDANPADGPQDGPGTWAAGVGNWWDATAAATWNNATPDNAVFGVAPAAATVAIDAAGVTAGSLTFAPASGPYTLAGPGTLTVATGITADSSATIAAPLALAADQPVHVAAAELTLAGPITGTHTLAKTGAGTVTFTHAEAGPGNTVSLTVSEGVAAIHARQSLASVAIAPGALLIVDAPAQALVASLTQIDGTLDLQSGGVIVRNGNLAELQALVEDAHNANYPAVAAITSSTAAENSLILVAVPGTAVGTILGETPADADVVLTLALPGDANLDGSVNVGDLGLLASFWNTPSDATWNTADFNFDGKVDVGDLGSLASNWNATGGIGFVESLRQFEIFENVQIPEPATGLLALAGAALLLRRRR